MNKNIMEECWENEDVVYIETCGKAPASVNVYVSELVKYKISLLMDKFTSLEWLAYVTGSMDDDGYIVEDLYIPKQMVTSVDVHVDPSDTIGKPIIGILHSHHNMSLRFSGIDHDGVNKNHDVSLLVTHKGMIGQVRVKTECGSYVIVPASIEPYYDVDVDKDAFQADMVEKISEIKYARSLTPIQGKGTFRDYLHGRMTQLDGDLIDIDDVDTMIEEYKSRNDDVLDMYEGYPVDGHLDREEDIDTDNFMYDDLDNTELYAVGKVRTLYSYRNMTPQETSVLEIMGEGTPEFNDYLDEINEEYGCSELENTRFL